MTVDLSPRDVIGSHSSQLCLPSFNANLALLEGVSYAI